VVATYAILQARLSYRPISRQATHSEEFRNRHSLRSQPLSTRPGWAESPWLAARLMQGLLNVRFSRSAEFPRTNLPTHWWICELRGHQKGEQKWSCGYSRRYKTRWWSAAAMVNRGHVCVHAVMGDLVNTCVASRPSFRHALRAEF
jgi:hypothetical protein